MGDEAEVYLELTSPEEIQGLPADLIAAAKQAAADRGLTSGAIITLSRSLVEPFITFSERRDLREKAWRLWTSRGDIDENRKNLPIAQRILELRAEQASMHGYTNFAEYATADTMAGSPGRVQTLLREVWNKAKISVEHERSQLAAIATDGSSIEPWDWRYYAEKVRQQNYNLDNGEVKPYFPLPNMVTAIFECARKLFNLRFVLRPEIEAYHPDVQVYEVYRGGEGGEMVAVFLHDNYARPNKRSGAWMSEFRCQCMENGGRVIPIVTNNNNFNKPSEGETCLLSFDDAVTLFHEFGHGLHGMLSNVTYRRLAGTSVLRDFVELPSQLYEHWLSQPEVLKQHARHFQTGEVIPEELLGRLMAARSFNQGFQTIEYTASALVDAAVHQLDSTQLQGLSLKSFEEQELARLGMPQGIVMRHRLPHFQHLFSSSSYAAAYYVYLWAEVLDADAFDAFVEAGDVFDQTTASRLIRFIYSAGNSKDPAELYRSFRGRDPVIEPMLKKKGLLRE